MHPCIWGDIWQLPLERLTHRLSLSDTFIAKSGLVLLITNCEHVTVQTSALKHVKLYVLLHSFSSFYVKMISIWTFPADPSSEYLVSLAERVTN